MVTLVCGLPFDGLKHRLGCEDAEDDRNSSRQTDLQGPLGRHPEFH